MTRDGGVFSWRTPLPGDWGGFVDRRRVLGLLTRRVDADSTDEFKWEFALWFYAAWVLHVAALFAVFWEFAMYVRRPRGPVGGGESPGV
jgi:hypothetical protein